MNRDKSLGGEFSDPKARHVSNLGKEVEDKAGSNYREEIRDLLEGSDVNYLQLMSVFSEFLEDAEPLDKERFDSLKEYIELRIQRGEYHKALNYATTLFFDIEKSKSDYKNKFRDDVLETINDICEKLKKLDEQD